MTKLLWFSFEMQTAVMGWVLGLCWTGGWSLRRGAGKVWGKSSHPERGKPITPVMLSHTEMLSSLGGQSTGKLCPGWRYKYIIYWTMSLKQLDHIKVIMPWTWSWSLGRAQWGCHRHWGWTKPALGVPATNTTRDGQPGHIPCVPALEEAQWRLCLYTQKLLSFNVFPWPL